MSIRMGPACAIKLTMVLKESKCVETRRFIDAPNQWYEISKKCITEKKFLIVTLCIDKNGNFLHIPDNGNWRNFVEDSTAKLLSLGANRYNSRIDIINEPMKYIDKITYTSLINIAHNQINGRLPMGAGCEEFLLAQASGDMYPHILRYGNFEVLVIHIQGSCLSEPDCAKWTNIALNWAISNKKQLDCNEANYFSIDTDRGYKGLLMNLKYAEKIGCKNFPMVFMNLDKSAFSVNTDRWERLSFFVNGKLHSKYWNDFKNIIESKAPIPNIIEPIIEEEKDMILVTMKKGIKDPAVRWLQQILEEDYDVENEYGIFDGDFGTATEKQVKAYQEKIGVGQTGIIRATDVIKIYEESSDPKKWYERLTIHASYR